MTRCPAHIHEMHFYEAIIIIIGFFSDYTHAHFELFTALRLHVHFSARPIPPFSGCNMIPDPRTSASFVTSSVVMGPIQIPDFYARKWLRGHWPICAVAD